MTRTGNPQVARYVLRPHTAAQVTIEFDPSTAYGLKTWTVPASPDHVAEMYAVARPKAHWKAPAGEDALSQSH